MKQVKVMGGRGAWIATPVTLLLLIVAALFYIASWEYGDSFMDKRLLLKEDFGAAAEKELSITATKLVEVVGMANLAGVFCRENGIPSREANALSLGIEELGRNIIEHGFNDGKPHSIDIRILLKDDELILRIRDDCKPFNLMERYELVRTSEEDPTRHIGIRMVVNLCDDIQYLSTMSTNNLIIRYRH